MKCLGVNALGGLSASVIVNMLRACWLIERALALISPGTGYGGIMIGSGVTSMVEYVLWASTRVDLCFSCGVPTTVGIFWDGILDCRYFPGGVVTHLASLRAFCVD